MKTTYIILMEVEHKLGQTPDEQEIEHALEFSTAAEALSESLDKAVRLRPARDGVHLATKS